MCGILGCVNIEGELGGIERFDLKEKLNRRGPDGAGMYYDGVAYLYHSRLSIIDIGGGSQPIFNETNDICVIFNGEIYNYGELQKQLIELGHFFKTNSDTEVIVHAYEQWGCNCVDHFRGMFAFAIWDGLRKVLFIARDRLGIKPLFYTVVNNTLYFASEIKALLQFDSIKKRINNDGLAAYFTLSYIPSPLTIYENIYKLPAGHTLLVERSKVTIKKYWDIHFKPDYSKNEDYFEQGINHLLEESVRLRMISDVPVGAFLSGGIDSGMIVAMMSQMSNEPVHTFCMGFGGEVGGYLDERVYAKLIATKYATRHHEYEVLPEIQQILDDLTQSFDEPFADHSTIPSYYLCNMTSQNVKVALSGLGGDELFGGYERYLGFKLSQIYCCLPKSITHNLLPKLVESLSERTDGHYTINHLKRFVRYSTLPEADRYLGFISVSSKSKSIFNDIGKYEDNFVNCNNYIKELYNSDNADESLDKIFYTDIKSYLPEDILACTDRISMWHSLEVRVPFLDHKLMEFSATIPSKFKIKFTQKKYLLRKIASQYLPRVILTHRKQGFVGPMASWMRSDIKEYIKQKLCKNELDIHGIFNSQVIHDLMDEHFSNKHNHEKILWTVLMFQSWFKKYMN